MNKSNFFTAVLALLAAPVASAVVILAQPGTERTPIPAPAVAAPRPALISHVVLVTLKDPADAAELIADSDRLLATIPSVVAYACGTPPGTDRAGVDASFSVGVYLGFETEEGLQAYLDHAAHTTLVEAWRPRIESMRIFDIADPTP
ncbi:MAG: Dabb family protein [Phycisphaerales bacterium]|nr:Dabb family protein [Phycisphaerales bacterium]